MWKERKTADITAVRKAKRRRRMKVGNKEIVTRSFPVFLFGALHL
jgi:hypothetical protein